MKFKRANTIIAYILFAIHYYLLSGVSGTICNVLGLLSLLSIYIMEKNNWKNKNVITFLFIVLIFGINIVIFQNIFSIFPMVASIIAIISFMMDKEKTIRGLGLISAVCWLIYAIAYKSYISILFEVFAVIGTLIAFVKNTETPQRS